MIININCDNLYELHDTAMYIMKNTKPKPKYLTFSTITSEASYGTTLNSIKINQDEFYDELKQKLFDIWKVKTLFDWNEFNERIGDIDKIKLNQEIINDALKKEEVKPVVADKYTATAFEGKAIKHTLSDSTFSDLIENFVRVNEKSGYEVYVDLYSKGKLARQVYKTKKPVAVAKPKPVKIEKLKPVAKPKPVKVTKPKVEDDLSFLDDLENIF